MVILRLLRPKDLASPNGHPEAASAEGSGIAEWSS